MITITQKWPRAGPKKRPVSRLCAKVMKPRHTVGPIIKNPPKTRFKTFVKLTDHTCASNDLTNFKCKAQAMTGNGNFGIMLRLSPKKLVKTLWLNLFSASFSSLELVCAAAMAEYGDKSYGVGRNKMD